MTKNIIITNLIFFLYFFFITPLYSLEEDSIEQFIYIINIKGYNTRNTVIGYKNTINKEIYLPFDDFIRALDFPIESSNLSAKGTFFNKNSLNIDLKRYKILVNNKNIQYSKNNIILKNNEMYFSISLLERIFLINIKINTYDLSLDIDSKNTFPIEVETYKINNRKNNLLDYSDQDDKNTKYQMDNKLFSYPTVDFIASHRASKNKDGKYQENSYSTALGGIIFDLDANIFNNIVYSNNPYSPSRNSTTTMNFSRYLPYNTSNGSLKYFQFGDISSTGNIFLNSGASGRGLILSSFKNHNINQNQTINIRDVLLSGWEVELYYNDILIGYKTQADSNGYYNFKEVPVYSGVNIFKLVFYGPFGEKRTEEKKIIIDASPVKAGEFAYNISFLQEGHKIIENDLEKEYAKIHKTEDISSNINMYYGIFDNLAITMGYARLSDNEDKNIIYNFYNTGLIYSIGSFSIENLISQRENHNELSYRTSISGSLDSLGYIYASYDSFNGIKSPSSYISDKLIDNYIQLRYNNYINLGVLNFPITLGYKRYKYEEEEKNQHLEQKIYETIFYAQTSYAIYNNLYATLQYSFDEFYISRNTLKGIINSNFGKLLFRGYYERNLSPTPEDSSFGTSLSYNFNMYTNAHIQADRYFNSKKDNLENKFYTYYQMGLSTLLPIGKINISYLTNIKNNHEINISYGISFGYNENSKSLYYKSKTPLNSNGNIVAKVFVDNNKNGIYDKNIDTPIQNAKIKINSSDIGELSNKDGSIYATSLASYNSMTINIDEESIEDIMLIPKIKPYNIILRPSTLQTLNLPFVQSGYIEGEIKTEIAICKTNTITISEKNNNKKIITKTKADKEGLFLIDALPYGDYDISIKCNQQTYKKSIKINNYINYVIIDLKKL